MKKKKSPALSYVVPAGYYLPADKRAQTKTGNKLILMAVSLLLVALLLFGIGLPILFWNIQMAALTEAYGDILLLDPTPYDKGHLTLSGETKVVEAGPFRLTLPANAEAAQSKNPEEPKSSSAYVYKENGKMLIQIQADEINYNMQRDKDTAALDGLPADGLFSFSMYTKAFEKTLGYNPFSSWYLYKKTVLSVKPDDAKRYNISSMLTYSFFLTQKYLLFDTTEMVYQIEKPNYVAFIEIMPLGETAKVAQIYVYDKTDLDTQYLCTISYKVENSASENMAFGIINSLELLPNAKEITDEITMEAQKAENAEAQAAVEGAVE